MEESNSGKNSQPLISVRSLKKSYDDVKAVAGIDFSVFSGELFGFLGPNGAGKTTTIKMLTGLARPDAGQISIAGLDCTKNPRAAQHLIGVVPDESNLYPELSGYENLCFCGALYGMSKAARESRADSLLEDFNLLDAADRLFGAYSKGMKRKLTIAAGIVHQPEILFLDEPTTGIDVASARQIRQLIAQLHRDGTTIFLTTHYIEEAERLCQRLAFIVKGKIVRVDTIENLLQPIQSRKAMLVSVDGYDDNMMQKLTAGLPEYTVRVKLPGQFLIESDKTIRVSEIVNFFEGLNAEVTEARRIAPSLEEVFVDITGIELEMMKKENNRSKGK